jgi:hypothetical protein
MSPPLEASTLTATPLTPSTSAHKPAATAPKPPETCRDKVATMPAMAVLTTISPRHSSGRAGWPSLLVLAAMDQRDSARAQVSGHLRGVIGPGHQRTFQRLRQDAAAGERMPGGIARLPPTLIPAVHHSAGGRCLPSRGART